MQIHSALAIVGVILAWKTASATRNAANQPDLEPVTGSFAEALDPDYEALLVRLLLPGRFRFVQTVFLSGEAESAVYLEMSDPRLTDTRECKIVFHRLRRR